MPAQSEPYESPAQMTCFGATRTLWLSHDALSRR
jgi:hypothetical protein